MVKGMAISQITKDMNTLAIWGYKLIDCDTLEIRDVSKEEILGILREKPWKLSNLGLLGDSLESEDIEVICKSAYEIPIVYMNDSGKCKFINPDEDRKKVFLLDKFSTDVRMCDGLGRIGIVNDRALLQASTKRVWICSHESVTDLPRTDKSLLDCVGNPEAKDYITRSKLVGLPEFRMADSVRTPGKVELVDITKDTVKGDVLIPDFVGELANFSMEAIPNMRRLIFGKGVRLIGKGALRDNKPIEVRFNHGLRKIGMGAFHGCVIAGELVIPETVRNIDPQAFGQALIDTLIIKAGKLNQGYIWLTRLGTEENNYRHRKIIMTERAALETLKGVRETGIYEDFTLEHIKERVFNGEELVTKLLEVSRQCCKEDRIPIPKWEAEEFIGLWINHGKDRIGEVEILKD